MPPLPSVAMSSTASNTFTIPSISPAIMNLNSKPIPSRAPPSIISGTELPTPAVLPLHPYLLHAHPLTRLPPRPAVVPPPLLSARGTPPRQCRRWVSPVVPSHKRFRSPSLALLKPPTARLMNPATGLSTPPFSSLNPNCVTPKPLHKSPLKGPRALMESWPGPRNLSGNSSTMTSTAVANMSTSPSAPLTSSLPMSSTLAPPSLPTTTMQYISRGPSDERFGVVTEYDERRGSVDGDV